MREPLNATPNYLAMKPAGEFTERDFRNFVNFLFQEKRDGDDGMLHAAVGLAGESGEVLDHTKKTWVYGRKPDVPKIIEEMGDTLHYFFMLMIKLDESYGVPTSLQLFMANNVTKLRKRYPNGFSKEDAILRRDVSGEHSSAEREVYRAPEVDGA